MKAHAAAIAGVAVALITAGGSAGSLVVGSTIPVGKHPAGVAIAAGSVWVTNDVDNTVSRIDPVAGKVTATVALRGRAYPDPKVVAVSDGALWVVAPTTGTISRIDPETGGLVATLTIPGSAGGVAAEGTTLWVTSFDPYRCSANRCFSRLTRIDTRSNRVTGTFKVDSATGIAAAYGSLWIVNHRSWAVTRFDPRKSKGTATIPVRIGREGTFAGPEEVAAGLGAVWVSHPVQDLVTRIDPRTNRVVARVRFPRNAEPNRLVVGAGSLWAVGPKQIFRIDPRTNRIADAVRIGRHPDGDYRGLRSIAVSGQTLWVTDGDADTVDRIELTAGK